MLNHARRLRPWHLTSIVVAVLVALLVPAVASAKHEARVMTRNVYLGADLGPALRATTANDFIRANGQILRDVDTNNYPVRSRGLAAEILSKEPDLVGIQEAALWRTGPVDLLAPVTGNFTASNVKYDFLGQLLDRLNAGPRTRYRLVHVQQEFDFEAPADYNGIPGDGNLAGVNDDGEINGRLTMRDAILAKTGGNVKTFNEGGGNFTNRFQATVSGVNISVARGWVQTDVRIRGSKPFRFVNTHLEAFGDPTIREAQAKELVAPGGPATGPLPVVLVGDLNSDDDTVFGGDRLAYNALVAAGFRPVDVAFPRSCCLKSDILTADRGSPADFDHHIDHVLTNSPEITLLNGSVTGLQPVNGFWDSDHAGVFSELRVP